VPARAWPSRSARRRRRGSVTLPTQVLVAQIPMLLAPAERPGAGHRAGEAVTPPDSALSHPVRAVECAELEDAVVRGSRGSSTRRAARLSLDAARPADGERRAQPPPGDRPAVRRDHLGARQTPGFAGAPPCSPGLLALARSRLASDACLPVGPVVRAEHRRLPGHPPSFASVFPEVHVFRVATDAILVGSNGEAPLRLERNSWPRAGPPS